MPFRRPHVSICAVWLVAVSSAGLDGTPAQAQTDFDESLFDRHVIDVDEAPQIVVARDLDGDADVDLASVNRVGNSITVLFNDGIGAYPQRTDLPVEGILTDLAVGDIDADGDSDFVAAVDVMGSMDLVYILGNDGQGGFRIVAVEEVGSRPVSIDIADVNGDEMLDVVLATAGSFEIDCHCIQHDGVALFLNKGSGSFNRFDLESAPRQPQAVAFAHVNKDDEIDLVVAASGDDEAVIVVFLNEGDASFSKASVTPIQSDLSDLKVFRFNDDALADIVLAGDDLRVFQSDGIGALTLVQVIPTPQPIRLMTIADVSGDARQDIVASHETAVTILHQGQAGLEVVESPSFGLSLLGIAASDVDLDGDTDIIVSDTELDRLAVLENDGAGSFLAKRDIPVGDMPQAVAAHDFNGDLRDDLIVANGGDGSVTVLVSKIQPFEWTTQTIDVDGGPRSIALADLDGDGDQDALVAHSTGAVVWLENVGGGVFSVSQTVAASSESYAISVADFDLDGDIDAVTANGNDDNVTVLLNDGKLVFASQYAVGNLALGVTAADLNGDAAPDIATANFMNDTISVLINDETGGFEPPVSFETEAEPVSIAHADVDADGDIDLATANNHESGVTILRNDGNGVFAKERTSGVGQKPRDLIFTDIDQDGDPDYATSAHIDDKVSLSRNHEGGFGDGFGLPTEQQPWGVGAGDVDGDGDIDILSANYGADSVSIILNTSPSARGHAPVRDMTIQTGALVEGTVESLTRIDGSFVQILSEPGLSAREPNVVEIVTGHVTSADHVSTLMCIVYAHIDHPNGSVTLSMRNWETDGFDAICDKLVGLQPELLVCSADAENHLDVKTGRIELSVKHVVPATFTAAGFRSFFDFLEVTFN